MARPPITRLAPSPTGALHLGNARTFRVNWLMARQSGWRILLRIEDIDSPRVKPGADAQAIEDLLWLSLDWDEGPLYQSTRLDRYAEAARGLLRRGLAYPCVCSRREVDLAASAPHADDRSAVYPGTCRDRFASVEQAAAASGQPPALRFRVDVPELRVRDGFAGDLAFRPAAQLGDFVIARRDGGPAYQLAVVVDDAETGVNRVVRGDDLLDSAARQILLYRALGLDDAIPLYWHLPLVVGADGRRLAKRHGDTRISAFRAAGRSPAQVVALLARWCGIDPPAGAMPTDLVGRFDLSRLPRTPIVYDPRNDLSP